MKFDKSSSINAELSKQQLHNRIDQLIQQVAEFDDLSASQNDKLRALSATLKLGFWEWDQIEGRATYYSKEMATIYGVSLTTLESKLDTMDGFYDCVHPGDLEDFQKNNIDSNLKGGSDSRINISELSEVNQARVFEYRIIWPNGEVRQLRELYFLIYDKNGVVTNTYGAVQDITDHQRALLALKQSEERYSSLFTQLPLGVQEQDYSSVKNGIDKLRKQGVEDLKGYLKTHPALLRKLVEGIRITNVNNAMLEMHGTTSKQDYLQMEEDVSNWWNDQWVKHFASELETFSGPGKIYRSECVDKRSDFSDIDLRMISSVVSGYEDTWERVIIIVEDISERKQSEAALIEAKTLAENASNAKTEFLSSMSHELRTPLNAILGFSQLFEFDKNIGERRKSNARDINNAGQHLLNLIDEILDLSRIETGQVDLLMEAVSLEAAINESLTWVAEMAESRGVTIAFDRTACRGILIEADAVRIKQVFLNLMTNAVKYNCENGSITITCTRDQNDIIRISIRDTGVGISQEQLGKLFQPFNRLGAEYGTVEGTGIGLVIARQLTHLMGGEIEVESVPGTGSHFALQFQIIGVEGSIGVTPEDVLSGEVAVGVSVDQAHLLVAEDNPVNQRLLAAQLAQLGYTADYADNGVEALKLWKTGDYQLVLTDIRMPEMDGYELVREIRALESNTTVSPIIAVTANAMQPDVELCLKTGANDVLTKPVSLDALQQTLEKWLINKMPPTINHTINSGIK